MKRIRAAVLALSVVASGFFGSTTASADFCHECRPIGGGHYTCPTSQFGGLRCKIKYDPIFKQFLCVVEGFGPCPLLPKSGLQPF